MLYLRWAEGRGAEWKSEWSDVMGSWWSDVRDSGWRGWRGADCNCVAGTG